MSFIRSTTLRASSIARSARSIRTSELVQPWQRALQRRTYASAHGHTNAKKSDLPWMATSLLGTGTALYIVLNQDLSHGSHDEHEHEHKEDHEEPAAQPEEASEASEDKPKEEEHKEDSKPAAAAKDDSPEKKAEDEKKPAKKSDTKDDKSADSTFGKSSDAPDDQDKPDPRKPAGDNTDMSGKQEGMSNTDTKHSTDIDSNPTKSKKGEGVAESAKLKGTVSTERPGAESEQRGKAKQDKDEEGEKKSEK